MTKILGLVFSKDRAAQLDLFLRSAKKHCPNVFKWVVLYTHSNYNHENGYKLVKRRYENRVYEDDVTFVKEKDFRTDVNDILLAEVPDFGGYNVHGVTYPRPNQHCHCVGFFTDDSVFYCDFNVDDKKLAEFLTENNILSLSTRLGKNIKWQNHWEPRQSVTLVRTTEHDLDGQKVFAWRVNEARLEEDYGRPISMDGNIHTLDQAMEFMRTNWRCVRTLDAIQPRDPFIFSCSLENSVLVNIPINLTYGGKADNFAKEHEWHQDDLNKWFVQGGRLDLDKVQEPVEASHQEYDFSDKIIDEVFNENSVQDTTTSEEPTEDGRAG